MKVLKCHFCDFTTDNYEELLKHERECYNKIKQREGEKKVQLMREKLMNKCVLDFKILQDERDIYVQKVKNFINTYGKNGSGFDLKSCLSRLSFTCSDVTISEDDKNIKKDAPKVNLKKETIQKNDFKDKKKNTKEGMTGDYYGLPVIKVNSFDEFLNIIEKIFKGK